MSEPPSCWRGRVPSRRQAAASAGGIFLFEETAGVVPLKLLREHGDTVGAELRAPEALSRRTSCRARWPPPACRWMRADIAMHVHAPQIISVGLPFLAVELASRDALRRSKPNFAAHAELLPLDGADAIFAYWRAREESSRRRDRAACAHVLAAGWNHRRSRHGQRLRRGHRAAGDARPSRPRRTCLAHSSGRRHGPPQPAARTHHQEPGDRDRHAHRRPLRCRVSKAPWTCD